VTPPTHRSARRLQRAWRSRGPLACALLPLAWLYGVVAAVRRSLHAAGWMRAQALPVPVIVVGNLIAGGAGKTPTVMALAEALRLQGFHPGLVSRGYGRRSHAVLEVRPDTPVDCCGDEPLLMRTRTGLPVVVGRDRVAAARALLRTHPEVDVVLSDDGLQHLRLARAAQVLVFDERGAGNGWLLPAGPLREPLPARLPPRSVVVYNADRPSTALPGSLARRSLGGAVALHDWWAGRPASLERLQSLAGRPLLAAAGMAHPQRFFGMLRDAGLRIDSALPLPDHFDFASLPWPAGAGDVLITEKDAIKLRPERVAGTRVWVVPLDFRIDADVVRRLIALLPAAPRTPDG
jgi:tetraacyldisaccharide 4'-kinase